MTVRSTGARPNAQPSSGTMTVSCKNIMDSGKVKKARNNMILDQKTKSLVDSLLLKNASFVVDESIPFAGYQIVDRIVDALAKRLASEELNFRTLTKEGEVRNPTYKEEFVRVIKEFKIPIERGFTDTISEECFSNTSYMARAST